MAGQLRPYRILCFGDSLTEGWHNNGFKFHPYTIRLAELFKANGKDNVELINRGLSGETVHPEMVTRLPAILKRESPFNLAIILGGTNDLAFLSTAKKVGLFENIKTLHEMAHEKGVKTCALTIPNASFDMLPTFAEYVNYREDVNKRIREFVSQKSEMVCLVDLSSKLPMFGVSDEDLSKYWDDDLHFTPQGYDRMAELIFEVIKNFM
eukprot:Seg540.10 transcript_id=Seg540.10/GoldUCD/mRNA.D3Y31 product="hypothetical protein" protein_id=Seg540.10/GoldUCD/D3Y31